MQPAAGARRGHGNRVDGQVNYGKRFLVPSSGRGEAALNLAIGLPELATVDET
ncbi:Uncharacterised protein [Mycobacteroides abscessus subsp. abscessus]|nr:Uncharacterised protein [Mycobacteroides abscessus subsp. abscessus]SIA22746.1 Uncharacterised protein [Mycobacteroides abscessus subsp. abscessus]SIB91864.1 Uncharacterised protein [Mycobacteroides abscessus subsp. abscessus]SIE76413.1 Uncharacterised protein [Mycobacteroides abscessus subsp. abscessus]SII17926.1 Uncharacterised protein [Mycobacteroides abscessus subsp. abscessus]